MTTQQRSTPHSIPRFPRHLLDELVGFSALLWPAVVAVVAVAILGVNYWGNVTMSGWDIAIQAVRWFTLFIGVHVGWSALPLYLAHGVTRREFWWQAVMFVPAYSAAIALMVSVTFIAEAGLYTLGGWQQEMQAHHLYDSPWQVHLTFLQAFITTTVWTAGGLFIAAAWYRADWLGGAAVVIGIVFAAISGSTLTGDWGPFSGVREALLGEGVIGGYVGVAVHFILAVLLAWLTWLVMRDVAMRPKEA